MRGRVRSEIDMWWVADWMWKSCHKWGRKGACEVFAPPETNIAIWATSKVDIGYDVYFESANK